MAKKGMSRGGMGGGMGAGGANMQQLLKQAQKMQAEVERKQEELSKKEFESSSGGGVVTAKVNGDKELLSIKISKEAVDPDDVEMLEDLVLSAINEAMRLASEAVNDEMGKVTGGMNLGF